LKRVRKFGLEWNAFEQQLQNVGVAWEHGLHEVQVLTWERELGIVFPDDYRHILLAGYPAGLINWRSADVTTMRATITLPKANVIDAVTHNRYWHPQWGVKPALLSEAVTVARYQLGLAPQLIPVCGRIVMPDQPMETGTPLMSHHGLDIVYISANILAYCREKFLREQTVAWSGPPVAFWDEAQFSQGIIRDAAT
jgi:hypothetical protein